MSSIVELYAAIDRIRADAALLRSMVQGDSTTVVQTENGPVDSVAKFMTQIAQDVADIEASVLAARDSAQLSATSAETAEQGALASSNIYETTAAAEADAGLANGSYYFVPLLYKDFAFQLYRKDSASASTAIGDPLILTDQYAENLANRGQYHSDLQTESDPRRDIVNAFPGQFARPENYAQGFFYYDNLAAAERRLTAKYISPGLTERIDQTLFSPVFDQTAWDRWRQPNIVRLTVPVTDVSNMQASFLVTVEDLARAGIVASDTATPHITLATGLAKSSQNVTVGTVQFNWNLVYSNNSFGSDDSQVRLFDGFTAALNLGNGDAYWNHTVDEVDDAYHRLYSHRNIPLPATYGGLPFKGIAVNVDASNDVITVGNPATLYISRLLILSGDVDHDQRWLNYPDDYIRPRDEDVGEVTVGNIDRIAVVGDSYTEGFYSLKNKSYVSRLSQLLDWNVEGEGISGYTARASLARLLRGLPWRFNEGIPDPDHTVHREAEKITTYRPSHCLIVLGENDRFYNTPHEFQHVLNRLIDGMQALGVEPIIAASHRNWNYVSVTAHVAAQRGVRFVNIQSWTRRYNEYDGLDISVWSNGWGAGTHPGTRANALIVDPLYRALSRLPRCQSSLKIYRRRPSYAVGALSDLLFSDTWQRGERWAEIGINHSGFDAANAKYYDTVPSAGAGTGNPYYSEYLDLLEHRVVAFADYALIDAGLPLTAKGLRDLRLYIKTDVNAPAVYFRKLNGGTPPALPGGYTLGLTYTGTPAVVIGDTYTASGGGVPAGTLTVVGHDLDTKTVYFTPDPGAGGNRDRLTMAAPYAGGTLTQQTGTGAALISYASGARAEDTATVSKFRTGLGDLVAMTDLGGGWYQVPADAVGFCLDYDRAQFVLHHAAGFNLVDVKVSWAGQAGKDCHALRPLNSPAPEGAELLAQTKVDSTAIAGWTVTGTLTPADPEDGVTPGDTTQMVEVTRDRYLTQAFTVPDDGYTEVEVAVRVDCRWFPTLFDPLTQTYPADSPITEDSWDYQRVRIAIIDPNKPANRAEMSAYASTYWGGVEWRVPLPAGVGTFNLEVSAYDVPIQVAEASVKAV